MLLIVAIVVAVVVRAFVLQTFYIPSESMARTLLINDRVLVNTLIYHFRSPHRGEVIVCEAPSNWRSGTADEDCIKRGIGLPGDHIVCCDDFFFQAEDGIRVGTVTGVQTCALPI